MHSNGRYTVTLESILMDPEANKKVMEALSTYPLYVKKSKEEYIPSIVPTRDELNAKILNHYMFDEIGSETVGQFLFRLKTAMNEIMPYYNQLFFSADQDYNIIYNVDYVKTMEKNASESSQSTSNSSSESSSQSETDSSQNLNGENNSKNVNSKTPQSILNISTENIDSIPYASEATWNRDKNKSSSTGNSDTTQQATGSATTSGSGSRSANEGVTETIKGNFGVVSAQDLVQKYRDIIINIEEQIIEDPKIQNCFMLVY